MNAASVLIVGLPPHPRTQRSTISQNERPSYMFALVGNGPSCGATTSA
jgi:hypothetical protein